MNADSEDQHRRIQRRCVGLAAEVVMIDGECALCRTVAPLLRSHIVPRWAYSQAQGPRGQHHNPIVVHRDVAVQTSKQMTQSLLCARCEQRFSVDENEVAKLVWQTDGQVPALNRIGQRFLDGSRGWRLAPVGNLSWETLVKFGVSLIWRAHHSRELDNVALDSPLVEELRQFLLGEALPPRSIRYLIRIHEAKSAQAAEAIGRSFMPPQTNTNRELGSLVWAIVCGIQFEFWLGDEYSHWADEYCVLRRTPPVVVVEDPETSGLVDTFRTALGAATPKGIYAERFKTSPGG